MFSCFSKAKNDFCTTWSKCKSLGFCQLFVKLQTCNLNGTRTTEWLTESKWKTAAVRCEDGRLLLGGVGTADHWLHCQWPQPDEVAMVFVGWLLFFRFIQLTIWMLWFLCFYIFIEFSVLGIIQTNSKPSRPPPPHTHTMSVAYTTILI